MPSDRSDSEPQLVSLTRAWRKAAVAALQKAHRDERSRFVQGIEAGDAAARVVLKGVLLELHNGGELTWDTERVFRAHLHALGCPYALGDVETWAAERDAEAESLHLEHTEAMLEGQHVDRCMVEDLLSSNLRVKLLGRYRSVDHPDIGAQERDGSALMVWLSEPHADTDCPFGEGTVLEQGGSDADR